jgi:hypothetical protein
MTLTVSAVAYAGYTDMNDWNLTESTSTYGGGTQYHISTGGSTVEFRWLDTPNKITVISANSCSDWSQVNGSSVYQVNETSYHTLFSGYSGQCFVMRGRTASGQGSMVNHDGRVNR